MLKQLGVLSLLLVLTNGKSVYDQRQDGRLNFHAQLDNIMIVIATPGDKGPSSLFNDIASQILELRGLTSRNKKISVADEEIVQEGKDPLSVKILRIEGDATEGNVNQGQEAQSSLSAENHSKALQIPKFQDIKVHINENQLQRDEIPKITEKKTSLENHEILEKLGISEKINLHESEKSKAKEIEKLKTESPEKIPQKFISFGTISSIDGKVVYTSEKKHSDSLEETPVKKDNQEKIPLVKNIGQNSADEEITKPKEIVQTFESHEKSLIDFLPRELKKEEIIEVKEGTAEVPKTEGEIIKVDQGKQVLSKKLEDQAEKNSGKVKIQESILPNEKKIPAQTQEKRIRRKRRMGRGLRDSLKIPIYSKSRMSLKKELPRIDDLKYEDVGDKNEVRLIADQKSQLKPIGEMLENCGPGRIRNRYGICQFDESFN